VVAPRDGYPDVGAEAIARLVPGADTRLVVLDGPRMQLSASEIRARAAAGRSVRYLVPDAVAAYIGDHALYTEPRRMDRS
jgi:nicotinate-nucleotide adenylyltransferase